MTRPALVVATLLLTLGQARAQEQDPLAIPAPSALDVLPPSVPRVVEGGVPVAVALAATPPTLLDILLPPVPEGRQDLPDGSTILFLTVDTLGAVVQVRVVRSLHPELDTLAREAALAAVFSPATDASGGAIPVHSVALAVPFDNPLVEAKALPQGDAAEALTQAPEVEHFVQAPYPSWAELHAIPATVGLRIEVDPRGAVTQVEVTQAAGYGFDEAAAEAAWNFGFSPGWAGPVPVPVAIDYSYVFTLEVPELPEESPGTGTLKGQLLVRGTRDFVTDADVVLLPSELQATTDRWGRFLIEGIPEGDQQVIIAVPGYLRFETTETFGLFDSLEATYYVLPDPATSNMTVVRTTRDRKEVIRRTIEAEEIKRMPGTFGDPLKAVQNLPGIARTPLDLGLLIVRGASPEDSSIYIDGVIVPSIYHFGAFRSVIHAEMFDAFDFYPGGYGPRLGRSIGGAVDVRTLSNTPQRIHGSVDINTLDSSIFLKGPWPKGPKAKPEDEAPRGGWAVAGRRSYLDALLPAVAGNRFDLSRTILPRWWDYQIKLGFEPNRANKLGIFVYGSGDSAFTASSDPFSTDSPNLDRIGLSTLFHRANLSWVWTPSDRFQLDTRISAGYDDQKYDLGAFFSGFVRGSVLVVRSDAHWELGPQASLDGGLDFAGTLFKSGFGTQNLSVSSNPLDEDVEFLFEANTGGYAPALWAQADLSTPDDRLHIFPGIRLDYYLMRVDGENLFDFFTADPRFHLRAQVHPKATLTASAGIYRQYPLAFEVFDDSGINNLLPETSPQVTFGGEFSFTDYLRLDLQVFAKWATDLVSYGGGGATDPGASANAFFRSSGQQKIGGFEVFLRHFRHKRFFGWISYTLQRSFLRDDSEDQWYPFDFDEPHILTALASYEFPHDLVLGARVRFVSGTPYTPLQGPIVYDADGDDFLAIPGDRNSARLPPFFSLDLRVDKSFRFKKWILGIYLELNNATNQRNPESVVYSRDYSHRDFIYGLPILPNLGLKAEF